MQCPYCGSDSSVTETRGTPDGLRRRRVCGACRRRFTTYERTASPSLKRLRRVARYRPKLRDDDVRRVARDIEAGLLDQGFRTVLWSAIVAAALQRLEPIDRIAAARLRANYLDDTGAVRLGAEPDVQHERPQLGLPGVDDE